ncbi:bifunctional L-alanine/L-glutamate racemase [Saprospiraceae bacterium]
MNSDKDLSYILNHLGEERERYFNAVSPPIIQSSNFAFPDLASFRNAIKDELENTIYTRGANPTVNILRKKLAALESTEDALVLGSGAAAIAAAVIANVSAGDHIVCVESPYSWTYTLLTKFLPRFGVTADFVDGRDVEAIEKAILPNTKILFLESPTTFYFDLQDLEKCAGIARKHGLKTIIDNSYSSPYFQNPAKFGIDIVVHSATKYINGHSDVVAGVICASTEDIRKIFSIEYMTLGAIISPHDAALMLRGLRTLPIRMQRSHDSALKVVKWLAKHPKVEKVLFPFHESFGQQDLVQKQMRGAGGLFSFFLKSKERQDAEDFFHALKAFLFAVSWGGHESLIIPTVAFHGIEGRPDPDTPVNMFRIYIGLEDPDYLIADLAQALDKI